MDTDEKCLVVRGGSHHATERGISAKSAPWHETDTQMASGGGADKERRNPDKVSCEWNGKCPVIFEK